MITHMIKRTRDKLRRSRPMEVVTYEEWSDIEDRYSFAASFMKKKNPLYAILKSDLKEAREIIIHNRVHKVREIRLIGEIQKIFTTPKEQQMNELVGQVKYIEGFLAELQSWIDRKKSLERLEANGKIIIRRSGEEQLHDK